ncbi:uncharacterized protein METZ01_LOCUS381334, partial [marine metagenome]
VPTYDYLCSNCAHQFEAFQSMSDDRLTTCPECKEDSLERLIGSGAGIVFKGSGFYETDYRSDSYKKASEADSKSGSSKKKDETSKSKDKNTSSSSDSSKSSGGTDSKKKEQ